jgi:dCMP deaminase
MISTERRELKDTVYLDMAKGLAKLSKDQNTQVGAVIVAKDGSPVSWGYNGTIPGFDDKEIPHSRDAVELSYIENGKKVCFSENKYPFMEHAEGNAIDFGDKDKMCDATIYVTAMPCKDCARKIVKRKISRVVVALPIDTNDSNSSIGNDNNITKYLFHKGNVDLFIGYNQIDLTINNDGHLKYVST